ncbi:MAG TPA: Hsp70 family protein [Kofleriaceae bacterium]|jgi:hypothetical protein
MIQIAALVCAKCGAPLANVTALPAVVECEHCGAVLAISNESTTITRQGTPAGDAERRKQQMAEAKDKLITAIRTGLAAGRAPYDVVRDAWRAAFDTSLGNPETTARVTLALAHDWERANACELTTDPIALARLAEAYHSATIDLAKADDTRIMLPYLAADLNGPKHYERTVDAALLAELARREPEPEPKPPSPAPAPAPEPTPAAAEPAVKKRKKLFGLF